MAKTVKEMFKEAIEEAFSCMQAVDDPEKKAELANEIEFLTMLQNDEENHEALKQCVAQLTSGIYEDFSFDMPPATVKELFNYIQSMMED